MSLYERRLRWFSSSDGQQRVHLLLQASAKRCNILNKAGIVDSVEARMFVCLSVCLYQVSQLKTQLALLSLHFTVLYNNAFIAGAC
jgi:hypothetical protein